MNPLNTYLPINICNIVNDYTRNITVKDVVIKKLRKNTLKHLNKYFKFLKNTDYKLKLEFEEEECDCDDECDDNCEGLTEPFIDVTIYIFWKKHKNWIIESHTLGWIATNTGDCGFNNTRNTLNNRFLARDIIESWKMRNHVNLAEFIKQTKEHMDEINM